MWLLLQDDSRLAGKVRKRLRQESASPDFSRIRCPRCRWRPRPSDRWFCAPCDDPEYFAGGCGTCWNTFATGGRCPGCGHRWRWTACLHCSRWSLHADWYEDSSIKQT